jgi:D-alanyl-D-alanine carboxypeptidase
MLTKLLLALLIPQFSLTSGLGLVKGATTQNGLPGTGAEQLVPGWYKINQQAIEPIISAPSAVVIDAQSGQILFKKNVEQERPIASITKLVTAYAYLKKTNYDLGRKIKFLKSDVRNGGRRNIYQGEIGRAQDYLNMALIGSDNSAATALARAGGFLENFNQETAQIFSRLNLTHTSLKEPTGLSDQNVSTALEIARLAQLIFKEKEIVDITDKDTYIFSPLYSNRDRLIKTTDHLLDTELFKVVAGKTGYTKEAGYNFVLKAGSSAGKEIIVTVLGAPSSADRFQDAKALAWWVFENFE